MKENIFAFMAQGKTADAVVENNGKVSETFVNDLRNAFGKPISNVEMRFKQAYNGRLIADLKVSYPTGTDLKLAGGTDTDLIVALVKTLQNDNTSLNEYKAVDHSVDVAKENEDMILNLFTQFLGSRMQRLITTDWISATGERFRRVFFFPTFNRNKVIKFCIPATDEINLLLENACKKNSEDTDSDENTDENANESENCKEA